MAVVVLAGAESYNLNYVGFYVRDVRHEGASGGVGFAGGTRQEDAPGDRGDAVSHDVLGMWVWVGCVGFV